MAKLRDVVAYLCKNYPYKHELSKARLTKMVYLADWRSCLKRGKQMTNIVWEFNFYGPYVEDVINVVKSDPSFEVIQTTNQHGGYKELISVHEDVTYPTLTSEDKEILDFVINTTKSKFWDDFIRLVYSTYPIVTQSRFSTLDLEDLARRYKKERALFE
jgi:uncharacterized protein YwgA